MKKNCFNITPFKCFVIQNFPFIEEDFDALTYYELICKIVEYMNNLSDKLNATSKQLQELTDYINNLNIDEYIDEKIEEMIEDGTLEQLISEALEELLTHKLDYYKVDNTITQTELQTLLSSNKGKVIEFENGTYDFTTTFRINNNTKLLFNESIINTTQTHIFFNFKETDTEVLKYNGQGNIEIIGGTFNAGMSFIHGHDILIKNVNFIECLNDHCLELCAEKNFKVDGCTFEGVAVQELNRQYVECVQIDTCSYTSFPWLPEGSNTFDGTPNENIEVCNCVFKQPSNESYMLYTAIGSHNYIEGAVQENILIHDNVIAEPYSDGIRLYNVKHSKIYNNEIYSIGTYKTKDRHGISFFNGADHIEFYNNFVHGFAFQMYIADGSGYMNIHDNTFKSMVSSDENNNRRSCIQFRGVRNLNIENNQFMDMQGGILYNYDDSTSNNTLLNFSNNSVYIQNQISDISEHRCRIYGTQIVIMNNNNIREYETLTTGYFLRINATVTKLYLSNNTLSNPTGAESRFLSPTDYAGDYKNVFGVKRNGYSGSTAISGNQSLSVPYNNFNKMIVVCGGSSSTITVPLYAFDPLTDKLDARSWIFNGWSYDGTDPIKCILTFNQDGTFTFSSSVESYHLRKIDFINE